MASPFFVKSIAEYFINNRITASIEKIFTGGAPVFPKEAEVLNQAFGNTDVKIVYGSTEAEPISAISAKELLLEKNAPADRGLNVGRIYHKTSIKIIQLTDDTIICKNADELNKMEKPKGEIGEIIVAGDHVLKEYYNNEEALRRNKIFIKNEVCHRTGDSGYLDVDGKLFLTGRCQQIIEDESGMIAPFIYENFLQETDGVEMGTILKIKKQLVLVIEPKSRSSHSVIKNAIEKRGARFDKFIFVDKIPRDLRHHSKIDYDKLATEIKA
jgi:acyl-CoA synthetase (AMP-forming)/AMP-acid ligase II